MCVIMTISAEKGAVSLNIVDKSELVTDRSVTCCFTGHRRRDLPFEGDVSKQGVKNLISTIQLLCAHAYQEGYRTFITGMADGADLMCGSVIMDMMNDRRYKGLELICAMPYEEQRREVTTAESRYIHSLLLDIARAVVITGKRSDSGRYRERNKFMVEHSSAVIAVYKEKPRGSGTLQTINMAKRAGLTTHVIELDRNPQFYFE